MFPNPELEFDKLPAFRQPPSAPDRSEALVRDTVFNLLSPLSPSVFKTMRKVGMPSLQTTDLPALSVFTLGSTAPSLGVPNNEIPIAFKNDTTVAISVARGFEDPVYLQGGLEHDLAFIKNTLLTNAQFTRRWPGALFESIPSYRTKWIYADQGETYFGELQLEMVFRFPESFVPTITDELKEIDVRVLHGHHTGVDIEARYFLWQKQQGYDHDGSGDPR
jgi:hypothetical protein